MAEQPATPILYLDVDDEITSAAARIRRVEGDRVALVVPFGSRLATSRINFRLLAREATERGLAIEIVAADASARALASSAGLVVHPSVAAFEGQGAEGGNGSAPPDGGEPGASGAPGAPAVNATVDDDTATKVLAALPAAHGHPALVKPRDRTKVPLVGPARPPIRTSVAIGLGAGLLVLLAIGAWAAVAVLPSATISLAPRAEPVGPLELTVQARPDVAAPDAVALLIPARHFTFDLEASDTFPASGVNVTETKATGSVTFSNLNNVNTIRIPAASVVRTEGGVEFMTLADATLPPASLEIVPEPPFFVTVPSTASVSVEALSPGVEGNVPNNTITVVPKGYNKERLLVANHDPTTGGARNESPQVSQADVDAALATLQASLRTQLDGLVAAPTGIPAGTRLFADTGVVSDAAPTVDPAGLVGTDGAEFELGMTATGTVLGVDPAPIEAVAEQRLAGRIPEGWRVADGSIAFTVGEPLVIGDTVTFPVTVRATQIRLVDRDVVLAEARGLLLAEARARLARYGDVEISLWPDWVTNVPSDPSKVTVTILEPRPAASQ